MLSHLAALPLAVVPWLDPEALVTGFGAYALIGVCLIIFAETGLLVGFIFPGDTLLVITGLLTFGADPAIDIPIWWVCLAISASAFIGGEVGYLIGHRFGPRVFERKDSGLFSRQNVERTNAFFTRFGGISVILARFVPVIRTFVPVAAGVGHMEYKKYSLYNALGAVLWGSGVTLGGHLLGYIPPVADFVQHYIDIVLLAAVVVSIVPALFHYFQSRRKAKKAQQAGAEPLTADEAVLDQQVFDQKPDVPAKPDLSK